MGCRHTTTKSMYTVLYLAQLVAQVSDVLTDFSINTFLLMHISSAVFFF